MKTRLLVTAVLGCLFVPFSADAQFVQDPHDLGVADTVRMHFALLPDANTGQLDVEMHLYLFNDGQLLNSVALGFDWVNDNMQMTEAFLTQTGYFAFDFLQFVYRSNSLEITNQYHQFQLTSARQYGYGLVPSTSAKHVATYRLTLSDWTVLDSLVFDNVQVLGAMRTFADDDGHEYEPYWGGRIVIFDANRPIMSNLVLSEDTLHFQAVQGEANPPSQSVEIASDHDQIPFDLIEDASWLLKTPSSGITPQQVSVSVTTAGLSVGTHFDSVRVESAEAVNSPQFLFVKLEVAPPPPTIGVSPPSLYFNAIAGGADPAPQSFSITNEGGSSLSWSLSKKSSWLNMSPPGGTGPGTVEVSVVVTGLDYGDYYDTIAVSDPNATNDPLLLPVQLSMASDLPIIEVIEAYNELVVPFGPGPLEPRTFEVRNGGGGTLSFTISTSGLPDSRVASVDPVSGTAPQTVEVEFDFDLWGDGLVFYDTLWVHSVGAVNSPVPVVFKQRQVMNPALIEVPSEPVVLTVYECDQGYGNSMPVVYFMVENAGGDDPMWIELEYESDLFEVITRVLESAPQTIFLRALKIDLPLGTYLDTIWVSSTWALNKPQPVVVQYDYVPGDQAPEIILSPMPVVIAYQEDSGPQLFDGMGIYNAHGGCMPWTISATPDWLTPVESEGDVPDPSPLLVEPVGYTLGEYSGILTLTAPSAVNSPFDADCILRVWKLRGDVNWSGRITAQDVALLMDYVFAEEHAPQPIELVGDVNCDDEINVTDLILVIEYLFETMEPLCGNPY